MMNEIWKTDYGTSILIKDMTESHAKNSLAMIVRRLGEGYTVFLVEGKIIFKEPDPQFDLKDSSQMFMFGY